jgi:predicted RNA-binding protein associated with RNAse of E/G family
MIGTPRGPGRVWPLWQNRDFDLGEPSLKIADLQSSTLNELRVRVRAIRQRAGVIAMQPMVLDVEVRPNRMAPAIDVAELNTLVEEPSLGLEGIRLMFLPEDEPL